MTELGIQCGVHHVEEAFTGELDDKLWKNFEEIDKTNFLVEGLLICDLTQFFFFLTD